MRPILATSAILLVVSVVPPGPAPARVEVRSPDGRLRVELTLQAADAGLHPGSGARPGGRLTYSLSAVGRQVLLPSTAGIVIDGVDLGQDVELGRVERVPFDRNVVPPGSAPPAACSVARLHLTHRSSSIHYTMEIRVFDAGLAFRYEVPGSTRRTPDEATTFRLPPRSTVWYHDLNGHYEGVHVRKDVADVPAGDWAAPPVTFKLPDEAGYAAITEAALISYGGMALEADGRGGFRARLGHHHPVGRPYALRFPADEATRLAVAASVDPPIVTPWRVVLFGQDLDALVNAHVVTDVSPPPDPLLFPEGREASWIKPGRAVWRFLDGGENTIDGLKQFSDLAAELGFEYHVVEGVWQKWSATDLQAFVDYSRARGVGIWLWKDSRAIRDPEARRQFFEQCRSLGVVGAKIDFLDHEAKDVIDIYHAILRDAAAFHLMINFHGANKPTGETRTWPNELTREGVYGLEHRSMEAWARHNTTLPFTRYLAGPGDYTPVVFGERRRETSWAHQIATAAIFTSPLLVYGGHPRSLLDNAAAEMIRSIPSLWDETIVLAPSAIGEVAVFARRRGATWFLAILNGPEARTLRLRPAFLPSGRHESLTVRDIPDNPAAVAVARGTVSRSDSLAITLRAGGGFIARFRTAAGRKRG
jgi:alpha-glucosidase